MAATSVRPSGTVLTSTDATAIPVAASTAVRRILCGPPRPAVVIGTPAGAVYLRTDDGELLAVLAPTAARLPMAAVAVDALRERPEPGQRGSVGAGRIDAGGLSAHVVRWWDPRPVLPLWTPELLAANLAQISLADPEIDLPPGPVRALRAALHDRDHTVTVRAASALIGLGPGLTPSGDDVLIGLISSLVCLGHPVSAPTAAAVMASAHGRTTDLSLALLRHASLGECVGAVGTLLRALAGAGDLPAAQRRLLAVGHGSGTALCIGVLLGAASVARA